jgi:predicted outer membrane repeat protein
VWPLFFLYPNKLCAGEDAPKKERCMFRTFIGLIVIVALLIVAFATSAPVQAAVFQCPSVPCLLAAINTANANGEDDTIQLEAGTYLLTAVDNETDGPNGLPPITSTVTLQGAGAETTVIERDASAPEFRIFHVAAAGSLTLDGLAIRGGGGGPFFFFSGGGLLNNSGTVSVINSTVSNSTAGRGGGISNNGTVTILNSTIVGNRANGPSGGLDNFGTMTITNSMISNNVGDDCGAIGSAGTIMILNSTLADNQASSSGGAICSGALLTVLNSTLAGNQAGFVGGGIANGGTAGAIATIINSTLVSNHASIGNGIANFQGTVTITNSTLASNTGGHGGGMSNDSGTVTITNIDSQKKIREPKGGG